MNDNTDYDDHDLTTALVGDEYAEQFEEKPAAKPSFWQRKRHMLLIGVGILFFGAIIVDRLINMYGADELPDTVQIQGDDDSSTAVAESEPGTEPVADAEPVIDGKPEPEVASASDATATDSTAAENQLATDESSPADASVDIETVFGSPLVFVSVSEPMYVITEDDKRFDLGSAIDEQTTLAGVNGQQLILEKAGDLLVVDLPEPASR